MDTEDDGLPAVFERARAALVERGLPLWSWVNTPRFAAEKRSVTWTAPVNAGDPPEDQPPHARVDVEGRQTFEAWFVPSRLRQFFTGNFTRLHSRKGEGACEVQGCGACAAATVVARVVRSG